MNRIFKIVILLLFLSMSFWAMGQKPAHYSSAEILHRMQKLNVLGNVLYVAAHPDDENTSMITYMANEVKVNTAYFSFTRGDGGQNLIGPEFGDQLGVIRTQELLAARRTDRGSQYFSRAIDFGYSKNPEETFSIWNKEEVLGDLVWIIRKFRPDIIITRFNTIPTNNHGHHTASAILAEEAFDLAANPNSYPDQLKFVSTWQPKTLYWNTYPWFRSDYQRDTADLLSVDIGRYNPVLGMSYSEISALSRSNHKSQGFGATGSRGLRKEYLQYEKGTKAENNVFEVVDISWGRVSGGVKIQKLVDQLISQYNAENPSASLSALLEVRKNVQQLKDEFWKDKKTAEIDALIAAVTGLYLENKCS
ncbi:MAG: PIG-L family deacetylase [Cyclobacteriaceae bacterium]|nr:PIG-L family deacetylase [Cyclobacteriaceae bacterium]